MILGSAKTGEVDLMNRIRLENFRCFHEEQSARLAPLTLLVGENSTGKTSFLALIRVLRRITSTIFVSVPDFKEEPYDLGSFDEIAHHRGRKGGRADSFEAGFDIVRENEEGAAACFDVTFEKQGTAPVPARLRLSDRENDVWIEWRVQEDQSWKVRLGISGGIWEEKRNRRWSGGGLVLLPLFFPRNPSNLTELEAGGRLHTNDLKRARNLLLSHLELPSGDLYASAPVRSKPHRTYDPSRPARDPEGDYVPMYLASVHSDNEKKWNALKGALEKFGKAAGLFDEISVRPLGKKGSDPFQVQVKKYGNRLKGPPQNLIDVGYGVSQVLPVITELLRDDAPPMFLLQQPEVHLHPSAQAALGSLLCQAAGPRRQLIVETHSDHLLDRVRMDVRDGVGDLKPGDVSVLFFERDELDVRIHSLRLDRQGNVLDAPPGYRGFFMAEQRRSLGL